MIVRERHLSRIQTTFLFEVSLPIFVNRYNRDGRLATNGCFSGEGSVRSNRQRLGEGIFSLNLVSGSFPVVREMFWLPKEGKEEGRKNHNGTKNGLVVSPSTS